MKTLINSKRGRQGRVLAILGWAVLMVVWLSSMWARLSIAEAREPAAARPGGEDLLLSSSTLATYTIFLPLIYKPDIVFFDDFDDPSSGWPTGDYGDCEYEYVDGRYRITVTDYGARCYAPNLLIPKQVNGTFSVLARRISDKDRHMLYGLVFGARPVPYAAGYHWALEIYPNDDPDCDDKPFFWLVAVVDHQLEYFKDRCTDTIDKDEGDWNELKIVRNGEHIDVYINGYHKGDYDNADELPASGYSFVEVLSVSDETIAVEFDAFSITPSTKLP